jgi:hypothetical protein
MTTLREFTAPLLAALARERAEHERHLTRHPCDGARHALAEVERQEAQLYRAIHDDEAG